MTENMIALIIERITEIIAQKTNLKNSHRDLKTFWADFLRIQVKKFKAKPFITL